MAATLAATISTSLAASTAQAEPSPSAAIAAIRASSTYRGADAETWAKRFRHRTRQLQHAKAHLRDARRVLVQRPTVVEAVNLACAVYGSCSTLWSLARCESQLNPGAHNPSGASGLMQFLPGTFAGTPFGRFSIWSPYANALAAGWMVSHGRRGEWVC